MNKFVLLEDSSNGIVRLDLERILKDKESHLEAIATVQARPNNYSLPCVTVGSISSGLNANPLIVPCFLTQGIRVVGLFRFSTECNFTCPMPAFDESGPFRFFNIIWLFRLFLPLILFDATTLSYSITL